MYYHPIEWKHFHSDYSNYPIKYLKIYHQDIQTLTHYWPKPTHKTSKNLKITDYNCWYGMGCNAHIQAMCPHQHPTEANKKADAIINYTK